MSDKELCEHPTKILELIWVSDQGRGRELVATVPYCVQHGYKPVRGCNRAVGKPKASPGKQLPAGFTVAWAEYTKKHPHAPYELDRAAFTIEEPEREPPDDGGGA